MEIYVKAFPFSFSSVKLRQINFPFSAFSPSKVEFLLKIKPLHGACNAAERAHSTNPELNLIVNFDQLPVDASAESGLRVQSNLKRFYCSTSIVMKFNFLSASTSSVTVNTRSTHKNFFMA